MAVLYNDITRIKVVPMHSLTLQIGDPASEFAEITFENIESDSSWTLYAVTQRDRGVDRTVAFKLEGTAIVAENDYQLKLSVLGYMATKKMRGVKIKNKALEGQASGAELRIQLSGLRRLQRFSLTWRADTAEFRPRLTVKVTGYLGIDNITDGGNPLFIEAAGYY
jgi:hypothetical protein